MDAENFVYNNSTNVKAMQLTKLHGSVNWIRNRDEDIEEVEYNLNYDDIKKRTGSNDILEDMMIYPLSQKELYFTPYVQLFRILEAELKKRDCWIIIGYSFRDIIIRTMFVLFGDKNLDQIDNGGEGGESNEGSCVSVHIGFFK